MKLHLPLNLLAALMTSFTGVTIGTATFTGVAGIVMAVSQANAADVTFNGTQVDVAASGNVTYDVGTLQHLRYCNLAEPEPPLSPISMAMHRMPSLK